MLVLMWNDYDKRKKVKPLDTLIEKHLKENGMDINESKPYDKLLSSSPTQVTEKMLYC